MASNTDYNTWREKMGFLPDTPDTFVMWLGACVAAYQTERRETRLSRAPEHQYLGHGMVAPSTPATSTPATIRFTYKNHRGEVATRTVNPMYIHHGSTDWHKSPQWLLHAFDVDKGAVRDFAMADIKMGEAGNRFILTVS